MKYCPCGHNHTETTSSNPYQTTVHDKEGHLIFAICWHGFVIVDEINKKESNMEEQE